MEPRKYITTMGMDQSDERDGQRVRARPFPPNGRTGERKRIFPLFFLFPLIAIATDESTKATPVTARVALSKPVAVRCPASTEAQVATWPFFFFFFFFFSFTYSTRYEKRGEEKEEKGTRAQVKEPRYTPCG